MPCYLGRLSVRGDHGSRFWTRRIRLLTDTNGDRGRRKGPVGCGFSTFTEDCRMLVLSRKIGERILIGDDVEIVVTAIEGSRVRIGIVAPRSLRVVRSELDEQDRRGLEDAA